MLSVGGNSLSGTATLDHNFPAPALEMLVLEFYMMKLETESFSGGASRLSSLELIGISTSPWGEQVFKAIQNLHRSSTQLQSIAPINSADTP